jgi:hypothetical protein
MPVDMIRRDLRDLAARGACRRVHGGGIEAARGDINGSRDTAFCASPPGSIDHLARLERIRAAGVEVVEVGAGE